MNKWLFTRIAQQVAAGARGVGRTSQAGLKTKVFTDGGRKITAIEQNPKTGSEWARLAQQGHKVVQFRDQSGYVGVAVDGKVTFYPK